MLEESEHLLNSVLPAVQYRQWCLSLPFDLRYLLAWNADMRSAVLQAFLRAVTRHYTAQAALAGIEGSVHTGAITVIQRASSDLRLNLHFHVLFSGHTWESIAGARGCTPQSCGYRDLSSEFAELGVTIYGVSTQTTEFQRAFAQRNHVPFALLSDADLALTRAMRLPTFQFPVASSGPDRLIKRMSWLVHRGQIAKVWYPVFPPQQNAELVLAWLREHLPLYLGVDWQGMVIARETGLPSEQIAQLFASSGIKRPHQDPARLATMFAHANLVITVRRNGALVGLTRCFCDGAWTCYVADLAVHADHQRVGIGKALLQAVSAIAGPRCSVVLSAGVGAEGYYAKVGFAPIPSAWFLARRQ